MKKKKYQSFFLHGKKTPNKCPKKARTVSNLSKMNILVIRENPPTQKTIAKSLNTSVTALNKIISQNLHLRKAKQYNIY